MCVCVCVCVSSLVKQIYEHMYLLINRDASLYIPDVCLSSDKKLSLSHHGSELRSND